MRLRNRIDIVNVKQATLEIVIYTNTQLAADL